MNPFTDPARLQRALQILFARIAADPAAVRPLVQSRLILRLAISDPAAEVLINGRTDPPQVRYSASSLRPDLDIQLSAESLHRILLRELRLRDALAGGRLKVRGPVWKSYVLEDIFHAAQDLYPAALAELDSPGGE